MQSIPKLISNYPIISRASEYTGWSGIDRLVSEFSSPFQTSMFPFPDSLTVGIPDTTMLLRLTSRCKMSGSTSWIGEINLEKPHQTFLLKAFTFDTMELLDTHGKDMITFKGEDNLIRLTPVS